MSEPDSPELSDLAPSSPSTFHPFLRLPQEIQALIWQLASPLTKSRILRLRISETTIACLKGQTKLLFSTHAKPSPFLSLCKSSRYEVLKELPMVIEQEGLYRKIRYNGFKDRIMLYQLYGTHRCAPEFAGRFLDVIKYPSKYPEAMKVFAGIRFLAIHWRWAPDNAPWNIRSIFPTRFVNLRAFSTLLHPFVKTSEDHTFWQRTTGGEGGFVAEPPPLDHVRPACQAFSHCNEGTVSARWNCHNRWKHYLRASGWSCTGYTFVSSISGPIRREPTGHLYIQITGRKRVGSVKSDAGFPEAGGENMDPYDEAGFDEVLLSDDDEDDY